MTNGMRWMGAKCPSCGCNSDCPMSCDCQLNSTVQWSNVNAPSTLTISNLSVPSSYRFWSAQYNERCNDGANSCPAAFDPSDPLASGPQIKVTPTHKTGTKSFSAYTLARTGSGTAGFGCHRYSATITDVPNATDKDGLWGMDILNRQLGGTVPSVAITTSGKYPLGADHGRTTGIGLLFDGLRKIEYDTDDTYNSNKGLLTLYPQRVWTPLNSRRWETYYTGLGNADGYCWGFSTPVPAVFGQSSSGIMAIPTNERYWDGTFQIDQWDSSNLSAIPKFQMAFDNTTGNNAFSLSLGTDQTKSVTYNNSIKMPRGTTFTSYYCYNFTEVLPDADSVSSSGTENVSGTAQTRTGSYCLCWSNAAGAGCLPFPQNGSQPLVATWVTSLVLNLGGTTYTQNGDCTASFSTLEITVPTDNGDVVLGRVSGAASGRKIKVNSTNFNLDACTGVVTGSDGSGGTLTMTLQNGEDCTECP